MINTESSRNQSDSVFEFIDDQYLTASRHLDFINIRFEWTSAIKVIKIHFIKLKLFIFEQRERETDISWIDISKVNTIHLEAHYRRWHFNK